MPITWTPDNLHRHTAKHYLGRPEEGWRELASPQTWDAWHARARTTKCETENHPASCPQPALCDSVHQEASPPYQALAQEDWFFAQQWKLFVETSPVQGRSEPCGTGPRGIVVIAVTLPGHGNWCAKTAYRHVLQPRRGKDPVLGAVRMLRVLASSASGGISTSDLLRLESLLLRDGPGGDIHLERLARALRS